MNNKANSVDDLLKSTFTDDIPVDLHIKMNDQFKDLRENIQTTPRRSNWLSAIFSLLDTIPRPALQGAMVFASLTLMVLGTLVGFGGSNNPISNSVASLSTEAYTIKQLRRVGSMECSLRVVDESGNTTAYTIHRSAGEKYRVAVDGQEFQIDANSLDTQTLDPRLRPVVQFLSRTGLEHQLTGRWELRQFSPGETGKPRCQMGDFTIASARTRTDFSIDMCTALPSRLDHTRFNGNVRVTMMAQFKWDI